MILSDVELRAMSIKECAEGFSVGMLGRRGLIIDQHSCRRLNEHNLAALRQASLVLGLGLEVGRAHRRDLSHAWRHRFTTLARAAKVNDSVADAIAGGHAPNSVAKAYGTVSLMTMKDALERIKI